LISLHPYDENSNYSQGSYALLPDQLQTYFSGLAQHPVLQRLAECDPYDGQRFSVDDSIQLRDDLKRFTERVKTRTSPEPPDRVSNSPGEIADGEYGWRGIEVFCNQFRTVLDEGIRDGTGFVSLGD
jgi:hypothetical protein